MTKQFTYGQAKETNRIKDKKIEVIKKSLIFFVKFCNAITDAIFLVVLMRYFSEKNVGCDAIFDAMRLPSLLLDNSIIAVSNN